MSLIGWPIVVGDVRGAASAVGGVSVVVTIADGTVVIPNGLLIDTIVQTPCAPEPPAAPEVV